MKKEVAVEKTADKKSAKKGKSPVVPVLTGPMVKFIEQSTATPNVGDMVEGPVISIDKAAVYVDLAPYGTGIIYGREFTNARDIVRKINIGDKVAAKVIDIDNVEGYIELSLKEAKQAIIWNEAEEAMATASH